LYRRIRKAEDIRVELEPNILRKEREQRERYKEDTNKERREE
jgi:hypothetical protein